MDPVELDLTRREAGSEYLTALQTLGLRPDALFWGFDKVEDRFVLMLVTDMVDLKGPLAVADLLFQAYNASATPKEIDPFVVRLHSPEHALMRQFEPFRDPRVRISSPTNPHAFFPDTRVTGVTFGDVEFRSEWIYRFDLPPKRKSVELLRRWNRFARNVDQLAA